MIFLWFIAGFLAVSLIGWIIYALTHPVLAGRGALIFLCKAAGVSAVLAGVVVWLGQDLLAAGPAVPSRHRVLRLREPARTALAPGVRHTRGKGPTGSGPRSSKDPAPGDCRLWAAAVADDGYGRSRIRTPGGQQAVRPQRTSCSPAGSFNHLMIMHVSDNPLCVRATENQDSHLVPGTRAENLIDRSHKRRHANAQSWRWRGVGRTNFAARSRELRDGPERVRLGRASDPAPELRRRPGRPHALLTRQHPARRRRRCQSSSSLRSRCRFRGRRRHSRPAARQRPGGFLRCRASSSR